MSVHPVLRKLIKEGKIKPWRGTPIDGIVAGERTRNEADSLQWTCDGGCGKRLWLAPSSLAVLRHSPKAKVLCIKCAIRLQKGET